jgi:hypothetical protein
MIRHGLLSALVAVAAASPALAGSPRQDHADCPAHAKHQAAAHHTHDHGAHAAEVDRRGDRVMGFGHDRTSHRFRLARDGGSIEVVATDPHDAESRDRIRRHLREVARAFGDGDFSMPREIHGVVPPGSERMKEGRQKIRYAYEDVDAGGRVRIATDDSALVDAVHEFLRFQIEDHRTGDPTSVE